MITKDLIYVWWNKYWSDWLLKKIDSYFDIKYWDNAIRQRYNLFSVVEALDSVELSNSEKYLYYKYWEEFVKQLWVLH